MYCPWCLEAELFYRNPKNRVAHLVLKNSSKHSENCRLNEKKDNITEEDLELLLNHNLFDKKIFFDKFLINIREKYNEQIKLESLKNTLKKINNNFLITIEKKNKQLNSIELNNRLDNFLNIEKKDIPTLYFGRIRLGDINNFFTMRTLDNKNIGGLVVNFSTKEKIKKFLKGNDSLVADIVCFAVIKENKGFYNLVIKEEKDFELLEI